MIKSEKINFKASTYPPNPLEASYWIDLSMDPDGNVIKSYRPNLKKWVPLNKDANTDQWRHVKQIITAVGLEYIRQCDMISLPSLGDNKYFKGDTIVQAIKSGDEAIKSEIIILGNQVAAINDDLQLFKAQKGAPNGLATLDNSGRIPTSQLPSYIDQVQEVYAVYTEVNSKLQDIQLYEDAAHTIPVTPSVSKIYVDCTPNRPNYQFRWSGTQYVMVDSGALIIGDTPGTAFDGARGKNLEITLEEITTSLQWERI